MKIRDAILTVVIAIVLLGPSGIYISKTCGLQLPEFLDPATADYLAGGRTEVSLNGAFSIDNFISGQLQNDIDTTVSNNIPAKAPVLFAHAAMQRNIIEASNSCFEWPCYPSYFNSEYLVVSEYNALVELPYTGEEMIDGLIDFSNSLDSYAADHPNMEFEVLLVDRGCTSASNTASALVNDPFTTQKAMDIMNRSCTRENIQIASARYHEAEAFFADFYKSDHHWNIHGVLKGMYALYGSLDNDDPLKMQLDSIVAAGTRRVNGPDFSGSFVRNGLYQIEDVPIDFNYDFSNMLIQSGSEEFSGNDHASYENASELNKHYQFYDLYYKGGSKVLGAGSQNALLVSDSFGSAFQWPLAECYSTLWTSNSLHFQSHSDDHLSDLCNMDACQKVIFVGCVLNYSNFLERNPYMFEQ